MFTTTNQTNGQKRDGGDRKTVTVRDGSKASLNSFVADKSSAFFGRVYQHSASAVE